MAAPGYSASPLNPGGKRFAHFKIADLEVYQIFDGMTARALTPGFVINASLQQVNHALRANGFAQDQIPNSYTVTLLRMKGRLIMIDSGNGAQGLPHAGHLHENMRAAGLAPEEISKIVISHFHPDHIYGLMGLEGTQQYPDIEILAPEADYEFWTAPDVFSVIPKSRHALAARVQGLFPRWPNISLYKAEREILPGLHAVATPGHTPGHMSFVADTAAGPFMVTGDITNIPVFNMHNPDWRLSADHDPDLAAATRHKLLEQLARDRIPCCGYHWGMPGAGLIKRDGAGYVLESSSLGLQD